MSEIETAAPQQQKKIALKDGRLVPETFEDLQRLSGMLMATGMLPKGADSLPKAILVTSKTLELGFSLSQASSAIMLIGNKPALYGDAMLALIMRSPEIGGFAETIEGEGDKMVATCVVCRVKLCIDGQHCRLNVMRTFSVEDAKAAKLWKKSGPWTDYPKRMLQMRARGFAIRDLFPDLLCGMGMVEEMQDYPQDNRVVEAERAAEITNTIAGLALPKADEPIEPTPEPANDADAKLFGEVGADIAKGRKL